MDQKPLFLDTETHELVYAENLNLVVPPDKERITKLAASFDTEEDAVEAFTGYKCLIPALGRQKWDGHVYVSGATGAGKSYLINLMLMHDARRRKVFLFTDHKHVDPSLLPMVRTGRLKFVRAKPDARKKWEVSRKQFARDKKHSIVMFDDSNDPEELHLRDAALRKGRHHDCMVVCVNHKLRDYTMTKHALTNARYVVTFPSANRAQVGSYMRDMLEVPTKVRHALIRQANNDGRYLIFHSQAPNVCCTAKSVIRV